MSKKQRGSEKLMASCTSLPCLTAEEMAQVAGGRWRPSGPDGNFPHGFPGWGVLDKGAILDIQFNNSAFLDIKQSGPMTSY